ncbi:MAG: hypothetical protein NVSMB33_01860 [Ktedonobacteraceae bacterium]
MPHINEQSLADEHASMKTILVVESDTALGAFLVQAIVEETPYKAMLVHDDHQALEAVTMIKPNLFLLGYHSTRRNGINLYDQLHASNNLSDVPAIILSTNLARHIHEIEHRKLIGLSEPIDLDELLNSIEKNIIT